MTKINGGIIIDLDVDEVEIQISKLISLENLMSDAKLIQSLDVKIKRIETMSGKKRNQTRGIDILGSTFFN